jgi:hypothetical protein
MEKLNAKLNRLAAKGAAGRTVNLALLGLGSVGHYLLEYLLALRDPQLRIFVVGRDREKLVRDVNILRVAGLIRGPIESEVDVVTADFDSPGSLTAALAQIQPDLLVNSSRAYSGIKYGGISWQKVRAYGLWSPLAVKYLKAVMRAVAEAGGDPIVINTSYSDATNAWLKSAGLPYPDFGSGNLNHLVPRIKLAAAQLLGAAVSEIEVTLATSHFHDVLISKEGTTAGEDPLLRIEWRGSAAPVAPAEIYRLCAIPMPVDQKRNMMNASSNFEIIAKVLAVARAGTSQKFHSPGVDGLLGGYPVELRAVASGGFASGVPETSFSLADMTRHNRRSIRLDGIEDVRAGVLHYTPELVAKVKQAFAFDLPREVPLDDSDRVAESLIAGIIAKAR